MAFSQNATDLLLITLLLSIVVSVSFQQQQSISLSSLPQLDSTQDSNNAIKFDLKLVNVDSASAQFEIVDDNKTTINYAISYLLTSTNLNDPMRNFENYVADTVKVTKDFQMQTNSLSLLSKQEDIITNAKNANPNLVFDEDAPVNSKDADSGEKYNLDEIEEIKTKKYEDLHRFLVPDLEPNRFYEINFTIKAKLAHLSSSLLLLSTTSVNNSQKTKEYLYKRVETILQLQFKFKTTFDYAQAALQACNNSKYNAESSCYVANTNCQVCKPTCHQVKESRNQVNKTSPQQLVLCEACPCDTSRSNGECIIVEQDVKPENKFLQTQVAKCTRCIKPYTGLTCNECEDEGIEFYKNEIGECARCECNDNALYDTLDASSKVNYKRRKCQAITGICTDCLFNTTGKHCHECKPGYHGDAVKRACVANRIVPGNDSARYLPGKSSNNLDYLNKRYTYKTLALFSLYIFCILGLIVLTFLCIKSKYYESQFSKNGASSASSPDAAHGMNLFGNLAVSFNSALKSFYDATKNQRSRVALYFGWLYPKNIRLIRTTTGVNSRGGIYTAANNGLNDDDRLNLAEYQVFDDSLFGGDETNIYQPSNTNCNPLSSIADDDAHIINNNPYRALTIKS